MTTRFCTVFDYQLAQMPDNAQFGTILETIQKYNDYRTFLEAIFADDEEQKPYGKLNMQKVCPNHNHKCWTLRIESYLIFSGAALFVCYFQAEENQMKTIRPP